MTPKLLTDFNRFVVEDFSYDLEKVVEKFAWIEHGGETGWKVIPLINTSGEVRGRLQPFGLDEIWKETPAMDLCPTIKAALDRISNASGYPLCSVRLSLVEPGGVITPHKDETPSRMRVHIPIVTNDQVEMTIAGQKYHWKEGEAWLADFSQEHMVVNRGSSGRVHVVGVVDMRGKEI